jgi:hypothetical protein
MSDMITDILSLLCSSGGKKGEKGKLPQLLPSITI